MECQMRLSQHCVQHQLSLCYNENKKEKEKEKKPKKEFPQVIDIANILVSSELKQQIQFVNVCDQLLNLFPPAYGSEHLYSFIANLLKECCIMMNKNDEPAQFQLNPNINGPGIQMYFDFAGLFPTQLLPNTNIVLDKNGNTMMYWLCGHNANVDDLQTKKNKISGLTENI
ncbi:hypothetical protein RFI_32730, partial [Reticulomyxa filosa]